MSSYFPMSTNWKCVTAVCDAGLAECLTVDAKTQFQCGVLRSR